MLNVEKLTPFIFLSAASVSGWAFLSGGWGGVDLFLIFVDEINDLVPFLKKNYCVCFEECTKQLADFG